MQPLDPFRETVRSFCASGAKVSSVDNSFLQEVCRLRFKFEPDRGIWREEPLSRIKTAYGFASDMQILRLINEAKRRDILRLSIEEVEGGDHSDLIKAFPPLRRIYLVNPDKDYDILRSSIGRKAAEIFDQLCGEKGSLTVSMCGGRTMRNMVMSLQEKSRSITITPTTLITRTLEGEVYDSPYLCMIAHWKSLGSSRARICACPPIDSKGIEEYFQYLTPLMQHNAAIAAAWAESIKPDVVFLSASEFALRGGARQDGSTTVGLYRLFGLDPERLEELGAIGHINYSILDGAGNDITASSLKGSVERSILKAAKMPPQSHPVIPAVSLNHYKKLGRSGKTDIVLATGGEQNFRAALAALKSGIATRLITDGDTLRRVRKEVGANPPRRV